MKVSDFVVEFLIKNNIDKVFGYIGGNNAHLFDSIDKYESIELVNARHEQGSGFAAEGYARVTSKTGVATVTSGPGATNLATPIASCFLDSVPTLFLVGDINSFERDASRGMRQIGFQDIDIVAMVKPVTKYAVFIDDIHDLRYELEKAYYFTQEGRKGPVLVSLPVNLQYLENYEPENERSFFDSDEYKNMQKSTQIDDQDVDQVTAWINGAKRPVILVGNGVNLANAREELRTFLEKTNIPMVHSLMGKDVVESDYMYNLGFIGRWGNRYGNLTLANTDLIIALGSRIDTLQTGRNTKEFATDAKVIQVDIDQYELGVRIPVDLPILGDVKSFLEKLNRKTLHVDIETWQSKVLSYKEKYPHQYEIDQSDKLGNQIVSLISKYSRENDIFTIDVGEHQMLAAQSLDVKKGQRVLFTGGLGSMGFALPAAIGAHLGTGHRSIVIAGDGGIQMNIQELEVIHSRNLPIKTFIINNACLYMVTTMQDGFLNANHVGTKKDYSAPDFKKVGEAYGIKSYQASTMSEIEEIIKKSMTSDDCEVIEIQVLGESMAVSPLLDYSRPFEDMSPYLDPQELEEQMIKKNRNGV
ncbi:thiamine pyrophosphate-binding protein [bacterium]|nr:thiamine pyrophosphate-binding protein [bacterium]MBU1958897.1 thiamine pyrophosphate-binding protein [bacterium]